MEVRDWLRENRKSMTWTYLVMDVCEWVVVVNGGKSLR